MATKSFINRIIDEFPDHPNIKEWFVRAVLDGDFSNVVAALDSKIVQIENEFPSRFTEERISFVDKLEQNRTYKERIQDKGLIAALKESSQVGNDYERLSSLRKEVGFFQTGFKLVRENFGGEDHMHIVLLKAVNGLGVDDLREALTEKAKGAISLLPRRDDGSLPLKDYFRARDEWKELMDVARELIGLKVEGLEKK